MPKISIIVPVYNTEQYLEKCLDSLVNQTFKDIEIIVVNDGSPDNSEKIIKSYCDKYTNIRYIKQENGGLSASRNKGVKQATGDYLMFLDSDDWISADACERIIDKLEETKSDILVAGIYDVYENEIKETNFNEGDELQYFLKSPSACNKVISRKLFTENNISFPTGLWYEDLATTPKYLLYTDEICFLDKPFYYYLQRVGSIMRQTAYNPKLEQIFDSMDHMMEPFYASNKFEKFKIELEYLFITHLLHGASLRFLPYKEGKGSLIKISDTMKTKFPSWRQNKFYKTNTFKYKVICNLLYMKQYWLINLLRKNK